MMRSDTGSYNIFSSKSTDSGATWSAPTVAFTGASGRPAVIQTPRGAVLCMYRAQTPDPTPGRTLIRASWDRGVTWSNPAVLLSAGGSYVYGQFVIMDTALVDGNVGIFFSNQYSDSNADNYWQLLSDDARAPA
jgi:Neuraminidase (sialidase)